MSYIDFLERGISTSYHGTFLLDKLYKDITKWAKKGGYKVKEITYNIKQQDSHKKGNIVLELKKKVSEYAKIGLYVTIECSNMKDIKVKNKKAQEGKATASLSSFIEKDYEDTWSKRATMRFMREFYDKFLARGRFEKFEKQVEGDLKSLRQALKVYFKNPIPKR